MRSLGTSSTHQRCWRAMNATLTKQFEGFAECCLELARSAETTERRARFIQMADEYRLATLLTSEELSSGPKGRRLLPAAESPPLIAAEAPASRAQTRPQTRLFARSAAPRHPGPGPALRGAFIDVCGNERTSPALGDIPQAPPLSPLSVSLGLGTPPSGPPVAGFCVLRG